VAPANFLAIHNTILTLLDLFSPDALVYIVPFLFKLQADSEGVYGSPQQRAAHNLVLQTLLSIAEALDSKDLATHLKAVKEDRVENNQWLTGLDFQPGDLKSLKSKSLKDLDKKKKSKPETKNTLLQKEKVVTLLLQGKEALAPFKAAMLESLPSEGESDGDSEGEDGGHIFNFCISFHWEGSYRFSIHFLFCG